MGRATESGEVGFREQHHPYGGAELGGEAVNLTTLIRRAGTLGVAVALAALVASPAAATPGTLKRSIENLTLFPLDLVLAPVVAGQSIVRNMQEIDDSTGVRIAYPLPGFVWNMFVQGGAAVLRGMTGVLELPPGLVLLFTDADMDPLFDPADEQDALVDYETPVYWVKFGINYTTSSY